MTEATKTREEWGGIAQGLDLKAPILIDGRPEEADSGETFDSVNPATGELLAAAAAGGEADVERAVDSARRAFEAGEWRGADPVDRKSVLIRLADLIREHSEEMALLDSLDMGKPVEVAHTVDVPGAAGIFQWYGEAVDKVYDEVAPSPAGELALITREPLGVIGAVVPWNFPLDLAAWKVAPALALGNSVVLKPAEQSPLSAVRLAELAIEAGLPEGVLNVVPGLGETAGRALGLHPDVDAIAFTGSTEVGRMFLGYSAESNGKPVALECGGKSPNLIFDDVADIGQAVEMAAFGIFFNQGEVCSANSRLLVQRGVAEEFVSLLVEEARGIQVGDPLDPDTGMGPLVDENHADRVFGFIEEGRSQGRLVTGGERVSVNGHDRCFVEPTVFVEVEEDSRLIREEVFGPVLAVVEFDTEEEAVAIANSTRFGLAASVWTADLGRAHRVAAALRAGTVSVNTVDALSPQTPFGGFGESGSGRDLSLHALDNYSGLKTTWIKY